MTEPKVIMPKPKEVFEISASEASALSRLRTTDPDDKQFLYEEYKNAGRFKSIGAKKIADSIMEEPLPPIEPALDKSNF